MRARLQSRGPQDPTQQHRVHALRHLHRRARDGAAQVALRLGEVHRGWQSQSHGIFYFLGLFLACGMLVDGWIVDGCAIVVGIVLNAEMLASCVVVMALDD